MSKKKEQEKELDYIPFCNPYKQVGRPLLLTPPELAGKFEEYVHWASTHPIKVKRRTDHFNNNPSCDSYVEEKPRLISVVSFLNYIGRTKDWWAQLSDGTYGEEFSHLKDNIKQYCEEYQYECAATWQYNANIVARYLGLAEKKQVAADGNAVQIVVRSQEEKEKIENIGELGI